jgi:uncharacterized protein (DUF1015 family)
MVKVGPFAGIRYSSSLDLAAVTCPPYDIISPAEQESLYERHPNNAVRLELARGAGAERYSNVGATFDAWLDSGVLRRDDSPSMYVYGQDFTGPDGAARRVAGVVGALELEELGEESGVLPHERTMPGPIEDRLELLRACPVNVSPIYAIYRGGGDLAPYFDSLGERPVDAHFVDEHGTHHRLWAVSAAAEVDILVRALAPGPLVIADGHHRYETALAYRAERGAPGAHDAIMCFCVDADAEDVVVLPYHRALKARNTGDLQSMLLERLGATEMTGDDPMMSLERSGADHPFAFVLYDKVFLVEVSDQDVVARVGERAREWRDLDVVALHEAVLPSLFPGGIDELHFSRDANEVARLVVEEGWTAGVLLRPLAPAQVVDVARSGERMPEKASYFWPKAVTGLVFRSLR